MDNYKIKKLIAELTKVYPDNDPQFLLEKAMFLENVYNIQIDDDDINLNNLGSEKDLEKFILTKIKLY